MPGNEYLLEGFLSQLKKSVLNSIPAGLKNKCNELKGIDLEEEVFKIISKYLINEVKSDKNSYEHCQSPESDDLKKLVKKKKYHVEKLKVELLEDYNLAISKHPVSENTSPYSELSLVTLLSTAQIPRDVAIETIAKVVNDYLERLSNMTPIKKERRVLLAFMNIRTSC